MPAKFGFKMHCSRVRLFLTTTTGRSQHAGRVFKLQSNFYKSLWACLPVCPSVTLFKNRKIFRTTVFPRSSDPFHIVSYYMKWATTSWTHNIIYIYIYICNLWTVCPSFGLKSVSYSFMSMLILYACIGSYTGRKVSPPLDDFNGQKKWEIF